MHTNMSTRTSLALLSSYSRLDDRSGDGSRLMLVDDDMKEDSSAARILRVASAPSHAHTTVLHANIPPQRKMPRLKTGIYVVVVC